MNETIENAEKEIASILSELEKLTGIVVNDIFLIEDDGEIAVSIEYDEKRRWRTE